MAHHALDTCDLDLASNDHRYRIDSLFVEQPDKHGSVTAGRW
jgi:hypothetical protein